MNYYTIWTDVGHAKLANAQASGTTVAITDMAVGDGGGAAYDPTADQTELLNQVYTKALNDKYVHADNPAWVVFEAVIPEDVGGWYIREVGLFDADGDMVAIGKYPETYKPQLEAGAGKDLYIRMIMQVSNSDNVSLEIDPSVVLSTRQYVDFTGDKIRDLVARSCQTYSQTDDAQVWQAMEIGRHVDVPGALVFAPNSFFCESETDYGGIASSAPFAAEQAAEKRIDLAQGSKTVDYGGLI